MKYRIGWWAAGVMVLACFAVGAAAQQASKEEVEELKRALEAQEKSVRELRDRINALEPGAPAAAPAAATEPEAPAEEDGLPISLAEEEEARIYGKPSRIRYRGNFDDKQEAAARPGDYVMDPDFRGFIPIPRTVFLLKFNPRPRVDLTYDSDNAGNDMRFVPATIPLRGTPAYGGGAHFNANGNGSQMRIDVRAPSMDGDFRVYYQNDFFGSDSRNFQYRLQHFYAQAYGVVGGFTYGIFEDPDAWPDTVDYEGPNSVIFARRPLLHYKRSVAEDWQLTFGIEDPDIFVDTTGDPDAGKRARFPDGGFNVRWMPSDLGHVQFSTIMRAVGIRGGDVVDSQGEFGWGTNIAGSINVTGSDTVQFWFVYGEGVGGMGNDAGFFNSDAALQADGDLVALDYFSSMVAYQHRWSPRWRSTATYGYVNLQNAALQDPEAYDQTHYASANLVFQAFKRLSVGVEGLYGARETLSAGNGDVFRLHVGIMYAIFD